MLKSLLRYLHTLRFMRFTQLLWLLRFRVFARSHSPARPAVEPSGCRLANPALSPPIEQDMEDKVRFLGVEQRLVGGSPDWRASAKPKLWRYNLHYFDYLHWPAVAECRKVALIDSWIAENPPGSRDAWEPYPVSLRIVNWVKLLLAESALPEVPSAWLESLAFQAAWLERNLEREILANHYLKNAKAMVFAGLFFRGRDADRWLESGSRILAEQIREQFLPDGGHYELSPMYHAICLEDLLDVWNLARGSGDRFDPDLLAEVEGAARRALVFLEAILMPNRDVPLFNDSAFGIAPVAEELLNYAARLFSYQPHGAPPRALTHSGYFRLGDGPNRMIIDCGPVSPSYQPGHTHCDMLSYELALGGRPIVVDTGTYDYEPSVERGLSRSTRAHNTVSVDGAEQSEVWGVFRVARRARPRLAELRSCAGQGWRFVGELEGFPLVAGRIRHRREVVYEPSAVWHVQDQVSGRGSHNVDSWVHLHPDWSAEIISGRVLVADQAGMIFAYIEPRPGVAVSIELGQYFPSFGRKLANRVVRLSVHGALPVTLGYSIRKAGATSA